MVSFVPQRPNINCALLLTRIGLKKEEEISQSWRIQNLGKNLNLKMSLSGHLLSVTFYRHNLADSTSGLGQVKLSMESGGRWVSGWLGEILALFWHLYVCIAVSTYQTSVLPIAWSLFLGNT